MNRRFAPTRPPVLTLDDVSGAGLRCRRHACKRSRHDCNEEPKDELQAAHATLLDEQDEEAARKEGGEGGSVPHADR